MNQFPDLGSMWKGRVLLSAVVYENDKPKLGSDNIDQSIIMKLSSRTLNKDWMIIAEILFGEGYPEKKEKYSIEVRWANQEIHFPSLAPSRGIWEWYERRKMVCSFPYINQNMVIFLYLIH